MFNDKFVNTNVRIFATFLTYNIRNTIFRCYCGAQILWDQFGCAPIKYKGRLVPIQCLQDGQ